jgi:cytochrome c peroxidase
MFGRLKYAVLVVFLGMLVYGCGDGSSSTPDPQPDMAALKVDLGRKIFNDTNLSTPAGQSCATCHDINTGFADPAVTSSNPVSVGADSVSFGNRNAPTAAYASFIPAFHRDATNGYVGGQFVDGRAATLVEQAKGPFLNLKEMANTSKGEVIQKIVNASYANQFEQVYGSGSLGNIEAAYDNVADAVAAFESSSVFSPFTSKFDYVRAGAATFTAQEQRGFNLFNNVNTARCVKCHTLVPVNAPLFTNFTYSNIGTPINANNPDSSIDIGLAANPNLTTSANAERGKFRVPTLRNIALTAPYMHNGVFQTLDEVMLFYNESQDRQCYPETTILQRPITCWPIQEVTENLETNDVGFLSRSQQDLDDIVAFLNTLTDGYQP